MQIKGLKRLTRLIKLILSDQLGKLSTTVASRKIYKFFWSCENFIDTAKLDLHGFHGFHAGDV